MTKDANVQFNAQFTSHTLSASFITLTAVSIHFLFGFERERNGLVRFKRDFNTAWRVNPKQRTSGCRVEQRAMGNGQVALSKPLVPFSINEGRTNGLRERGSRTLINGTNTHLLKYIARPRFCRWPQWRIGRKMHSLQVHSQRENDLFGMCIRSEWVNVVLKFLLRRKCNNFNLKRSSVLIIFRFYIWNFKNYSYCLVKLDRVTINAWLLLSISLYLLGIVVSCLIPCLLNSLFFFLLRP